MSSRNASNEPEVRRAFDLLLKIRGMPEGPRLLPCAVAFLDMLVRKPHGEGPPLVVSVRTVPLRKR